VDFRLVQHRRYAAGMKAGPFEFYWHPGPGTVAAEVRGYLAGAPEVQRAVARMARSEVKSYLAGLAEEAGIPFSSPGAFLRGLRRDPDDPCDPAEDVPFSIREG
jgi:hypothetical protein